jgi:predicted NBD/HSP70 family sugar kinase
MTVGVRPDDLRRRNRAMVIGAIRRTGRSSRTEIAAITKLSPSTISAIAADLLGESVLAAAGAAEAASAKRGRPQVDLALNPDAAAIVTVVLSLNSLSAAIIDYTGEVVRQEHQRLPTLELAKEALVSETVAAARRLIMPCSRKGKRLMRIALAVQGTTDSAARTMLWSPITPHANIAFADVLENGFEIPVTVENDCNMIAEALRWRDPSRYRSNFIAVLLSHGIGMGLVLNEKLFIGTQSSGGEFGHMVVVPGGALCRCGQRGCIEAYAGSYAIWRRANGIAETEPPAADIDDDAIRALADAARTQDGPEREAFRCAGEAIGYGLGSLFALIDPAPVALVGLQASAFDLIEKPMHDALAMTAGGQHHATISFEAIADELPLIRQGCAMRALTFVDQEIFAPGFQGMPAPDREDVT